MSGTQKFVLIIAFAAGIGILVYLLLKKKKDEAATDVSTRIFVDVTRDNQPVVIDRKTGVEVGPRGIRSQAIGPALPPITTSGPMSAWNCPQGYRPIVDPEDGGLYCILKEGATV